MKRSEVKRLIPVALQELHDAGFERVYYDQLGQQVTRHEEGYLARRDAVRGFLRHINVELDELPSGHVRPAAYKMYTSLGELERAGVIAGEFEPPRDDEQLVRRQYFLLDSALND